jgi:hypothetical protein
MKVFTQDELEMIRLEAGRRRIATLRAKLQQMKNMATFRFSELKKEPDSRGEDPSTKQRK